MNYIYKDERIDINIKAKDIDKLVKELEDKIYANGMYRKMCGSNDITVELDEDETDVAFEELEDGEDWRLIFKVTHNQYEEDSGSSEWWKITVDVDKDLKIKNVEVY